MISPELHIVELRKFSSELLELSKQLVTGTFVRAHDYFGNMAILFLQKQADHIVSAFLLGTRSDVQLIARSMVEGIAQLFWASLPSQPGQPPRPLLWAKYEWVVRWKYIQEAKQTKTRIDPVVRRRTNYHVRRYGPWYAEARNPPRTGRYRNEWHPTNIRQMFVEIDRDLANRGLITSSMSPGDSYYRKFYQPYSGWHHWSPASVRGKTNPDGEASVRYVSSSPAEAAEALFTALLCLMLTAQVVDEHFKKGRDQELIDLYNRYTTWRDANRP